MTLPDWLWGALVWAMKCETFLLSLSYGKNINFESQN